MIFYRFHRVVAFCILSCGVACTPTKRSAAPGERIAAKALLQTAQFDPTLTGFYFDEDKTLFIRQPALSFDGPAYKRETRLVFKVCLKSLYDLPLQQGRFEVAFETDLNTFNPIGEGSPQRDGCFHTENPIVLEHSVDDLESYKSYYLVIRDKSVPEKRIALLKQVNVFQNADLFVWDPRNGEPEAPSTAAPVLSLGVPELSYFYPGQKADYQVDKWGHLTLKQFSRFRFTPVLKRHLSYGVRNEPQTVETHLWPGLKVKLRIAFVASDLGESDLAAKRPDGKMQHLRFLSLFETEAVVGKWGEIDIPVGFAYDFSEGPLLETFTQAFVEVSTPKRPHVGKFVGVFPFSAVNGDMSDVKVTDLTADNTEFIQTLEDTLVTKPGRSMQEVSFSEAKVASLLPAKLSPDQRLFKPRRPEPVDPDTDSVYRTRAYFVASAAGIPKHVRSITLSEADWEAQWPEGLDKSLQALLLNRLARKEMFYPLYNGQAKALTPQEEALARQLRSPHAIYRVFAPLVGRFCSYFFSGKERASCLADKDKKPFKHLSMEVLEFLNGRPSVEKKHDEMDLFQAMAEYFREDLTSLKTSEGQQRTTTKRQESGWDASPKFFGIGGGMGGGWSYNNGNYWHSDFAHVLDERVRGRTRQFGQLFVQIAKLYLSAEVSTCLLVSPKKKGPDDKGLFFCVDQHKEGIEHNWYYVDQEQQYRGFFKPSSRNQGDRKWLKIMRGKEFYDRLKRVMKARIVLILRQSDGSINGVDHIINGALSELDQLTFQTHTLGKHRDLGIYPGVIFYRDVERVYDDLLSSKD